MRYAIWLAAALYRGRRRLEEEAECPGCISVSFERRSSMSSAMSGRIKFMTYNVWSCESVAVYRRIKSICEIIEQHDPDVIFLQEVTRYIFTIFEEAPWWGTYQRFLPEGNDPYSSHFYDSNPPSSCLVLSKLGAGRVALPKHYDDRVVLGDSPPRFPPAGNIPSDLRSAWVYTKRHRLRAATCRLPSPSPSSIGYEHRRARTSAFLEHFDAVHQPGSFVLDENVVLGGDLGWDDDVDGPLRLGDGGWVDAWLELRGRGGWTYDAVSNPMLKGLNDLPAERRRPDRFICKPRDFTLESIEMLGVEHIPDVVRFDDKGDFVPIFPSHHFGLLLTIKPKHN